MIPERRRRAEEIGASALTLAKTARGKYLESACAGDAELRREVESLLAQDRPASEDVGTAQLETMTRVDTPHFSIPPGSAVGPYLVESLLGVGGMGEVYRGSDTRLRRAVALKFLSREYAADAGSLERFQREARAASALNHPNICTVYDIGDFEGRPFIAMEYLEGQTLRSRLNGSPLAADQVIEYAAQIAEGLAAAHEKGIVHRDLKPENLSVTHDGRIKILDFGLAKLAEPAEHPESSTVALATEPGKVMGTVGYMSPEQALGEEVDARTDLFSFGVLLYELAAGSRPFQGTSAAAIYDAILNKPPAPLASVNPALPIELERIIFKALEKNREVRYQSAKEIFIDLRRLKRDISSGSAAIQPAGRVAKKQSPRHLVMTGGAIGALIMIAAGYLAWNKWFRTSLPPAEPVHRQITFRGDAGYPAISPDGKFVAYVAGIVGVKRQGQKLMLQDVKGGPAIQLASYVIAGFPKWSPDGSELVYTGITNGEGSGIYLIPRLGGAPRRIAAGGLSSWSPDGTQIAVASLNQRRVSIIHKTAGTVKDIPVNGIESLYGLDWSPSSNLIALLTKLENGKDAIWTINPAGTLSHKLIEADALFSPCWSTTVAEIYFFRGEKDNTKALARIPVDLKTGLAKGPASVLLNGLEASEYFTISADGAHLAYARHQHSSNLWLTAPAAANPKRLETQQLTTGTSEYGAITVSPDSKWIAFTTGAPNANIFKMPIEGGTPVQLTFSAARHFDPAWSPDGKRIAFGSDESGTNKIWVMDADGHGARPFLKTDATPPADGLAGEITWAPTGIHYRKVGNRGRNYSILNPESEEERPLVQDESIGHIFYPRYSPDGEKIAVYWNRKPERGVWLISVADNSAVSVWNGVFFPVGWSADSKSIYALRVPEDTTIVSIPTAGGPPRAVWTQPGAGMIQATVSPDGKKILGIVADEKSDIWLTENFDRSRRR